MGRREATSIRLTVHDNEPFSKLDSLARLSPWLSTWTVRLSCGWRRPRCLGLRVVPERTTKNRRPGTAS